MLFLFVQSISWQGSRYGLLHDVQYKNIACFFSNYYEKQPALRFLKVQAAFDTERSSENYFSGSFEITGNMGISLGHDPSYVCYRLDYGMVWNHSVTTKTACVPHTPYTSILRFASPAGRVCGVAMHAVGRGAGYGLLAVFCYSYIRYTGTSFSNNLGLWLFLQDFE